MLDKRSKYILFVFAAALLLLVITEIARPKPIDWRPNYTAQATTPFGAHVFYKELPDLFKNTKIENITEDPFLFLQDSTNYKKNSAYMFVNNYTNFDEEQTNALLEYASKGNTVFISAGSIGYRLRDTLKILKDTRYNALEEELKPTLFTPSFKVDSLPKFKRGLYKTTFSKIDTLNTQALGYFTTKDSILNELNFIKVTYGKGAFLLHTLPEAFSNYYLLKDSQDYAAGVLSYINNESLYIDHYIKSGRKIVTTPMRYILAEAPLKWALYLMLTSTAIFMIFKSKREQRIIKVINPLENTSIAFTKTIGDLYFQQKDYSNIISKKITYFLEVIRSKYFLNTNELDDRFIEKLALKSGNNNKKTKQLILAIKHLKQKSSHTELDLITLNKQMEAFTL